MADMVTAEKLREEKKKHPKAAVVCYINSSAEVKAESDICCTSANAVRSYKIRSAKRDNFVPDRVARMLPVWCRKKQYIYGKGFCVTHHRVTKAETEEP